MTALVAAACALLLFPAAAAALTDPYMHRPPPEPPGPGVRSGPNLTLVISSCHSAADMATAADAANHMRNAAAACIGHQPISTTSLGQVIDQYAPDRVIVIGGPRAVSGQVYREIRNKARAAYRYSIVERIGGRDRFETSAMAARMSLEAPSRYNGGRVVLVLADTESPEAMAAAVRFSDRFSYGALVLSNAVDDGEHLRSLVEDYDPVRVIHAHGWPDEFESVRMPRNTARILADAGSSAVVEIIALAGPADPQPAAAFPGRLVRPMAEAAAATFLDILLGEHDRARPGDTEPGGPAIAVTDKLSRPQKPYRGPDLMSYAPQEPRYRLSTVQAAGSGRQVLTYDSLGWDWSPDGRAIAWADTAGSLGISKPGGGTTAVSSDGPVMSPSWSPDGSRMVTFATIGQSDEVAMHLRTADGSLIADLGPVSIRTLLYSSVPWSLWSPDGTKLAYSGYETLADGSRSAQRAVLVKDVTGEESARPVWYAGYNDHVIAWSPDSSRLALAAYTPTPIHADMKWRIVIARADRRVGESSYVAYDDIDFDPWSLIAVNPWSADSEHIAYISGTGLIVMSADSGDTTASAAGAAAVLGWSPDGRYIEYSMGSDTSVLDLIRPEQSWAMRYDGLENHRLGDVSPHAFGWAVWSDDSEWKAWTDITRDEDGYPTGERAVIGRRSGEGHPIVIAESGNALSWKPGAQQLAYVERHDDDMDGIAERQSLRLYDVGSHSSTELVHELDDDTRVGLWSPDGSHIAYVSGPVDSLLEWIVSRGAGADLWIVAADSPEWAYRVSDDVTWGEWQPRPADDAASAVR